MSNPDKAPNPSPVDDMAPYFSGEQLYGDDFTPEEIRRWYGDEAEGYAQLEEGLKAKEKYSFHALNRYYGFRHLAGVQHRRILGLGSASGEELRPVLPVASRVVIVEPSDAFVRQEIDGVPVTYVKPRPDGVLPFEDGSFDLVTCFSALHHIPNVTAVVREVSRCMSKGGQMLLREPVTSMGDWRVPRKGLTKHERGFPEAILRRILLEAGLAINREHVCMFSVIGMLAPLFGIAPYNSSFIVQVDRALCALSRWNMTYHREAMWRKFAPWSVFLVLEKQ
jgi:SAM-dependent methyltransferase